MILKNKKITYFVFFLFAVFSIISVVRGLENAMSHSEDFQWSPSLLFWDGVNPYSYFLNGNEKNRIILSQAPNYLHSVYIFLYPYTLVDWEVAKILWAISSLLFAVVSVCLLCRIAGCTLNETLIILFVFLCSTPLRNTIGNGQHSTLVLLAFCGFFIKRRALSDLSTGFGFFKYSFMPPLFLYLFFVRGFKSVAFLTFPSLIGWLAFSFYLGIAPYETLLLPLKVSSISVSNGIGDIMSIIGLVNSKTDSFVLRIASYAIPLILSFVIAYYLSRSPGDSLYVFSVICVSSLFLFKHLGYDYVLLLPAFIYAFKTRYSLMGSFALGLILFNWFGLKVLHHIFSISDEIMIPFNFILMILLTFILSKINEKECV